tara:strand:- start:24 stop:926 length:903 start_codon:yes stop_codon:yes gene_type:complete
MKANTSEALDMFIKLTNKRVNSSLDSVLSLSSPEKRLVEAMRYATIDGGKRIRPLLVYASAKAVGAKIEDADAAACAVELIHSFSLVHDDLPVMDDDDLRRGKPSVHKAYGEATAVLVGDALQSLAFQCLSTQKSNLSESTKLTMVEILSEATGADGMTGGQVMDLEAERIAIDISVLEKIHQRKTGALIKASVKLGAICNPQVQKKHLESLENFADIIGLAFQVQDDILDEISETSTLGKPQGSDRAKNKTTYVSLLGIEEARKKTIELSKQALFLIQDLPAPANELRGIAEYIISRVH